MFVIVSCDEMKAFENKAFASGVAAEALMDEAGGQIAQAVQQFFPIPGRLVTCFGKGHNGGDALAAARHLALAGWSIELDGPFLRADLSDLTSRKLAELEKCLNMSSVQIKGPLVILDGLLGIGAAGPLRSPLRACTARINRRRQIENATTFAIDLPTGLDGDTGETDADCVVADFTLAIGCGKKGLFADRATNFVGRVALLRLKGLDAVSFHGSSNSSIATAEALAAHLPRRAFDSNKGQFGRIGIIAGAVGTTGAAVMSAEGALRGGGGLITLFATPEIYPILAEACSPEIMVRPVESYGEAMDAKLDVIAIGPGLGSKHSELVNELIEKFPGQMVVDADALNIVAGNTEVLSRCLGKRLLTPHPGEMGRLFETNNRTRREIAKEFTATFPVTLLFKGSRTIVAESGAPLSYNTTGSPGMATGGMGDVLTGVCAALMGQGLSCYNAAAVGAWICGRSAEIAIHEGAQSEESLVATDVISGLGAAFEQLRGHCF